MIPRNKHNGYSSDGVRRLYIDMGSDAPSSTKTTQTTDLPEWAKPYAKEALGKAQALTDTSKNPYQAYTQERIAGFSPLQQQAFQGAGMMQPSQETGLASGAAGMATMGALNTQYNPYRTGQFTGNTAARYMSPFIEQAMEPQLREAQRASEIQRTADQSAATRAGAFGGGRQAIVEAERQRNLGTQLGDIRAKGYQTAFEQAQNQFNTEQQLRENSRQYGAGLGLQGLQTALTGAGQLANIGQQGFAQQMDINKLQQQYGAMQQQQEQAQLTQQYEDFLNQQRYPYQQLEFMSNILRGTPMGTTSTLYQPTASPLTQALGGAGALYSTGAQAGFFAEGGEVKGYAKGGTAVANPYELQDAMDGMPDAGLAQMAQVPDITALAKMQIDAEQAARNKMRSAYAAQQAQQQVPQQTVAQEVMSQLDQGLGAAPLPEEFFSAAGGGIVAMADGGDPEIERLRKRAEAQKNTVVPQNTAAAGLGAAKVPAAAKTKAPAQQTAAAESSEKSAKPVGGLRGAQAAFEAAQNEGLAAFKAAQPDYKTLGADYKAKVEGLGQYGVDRENDLAAQEESAQREFEQERWGALALGFAEMASTPGSLFEAIAAGAKVGSKELSTIQQAHKELKREIAKERALIAEKRRAEALGLADKVVEFDKLAAEQSLKIAEKQVDVKNAVAKSGIDVEQALLNAQTQKDVASTYAGSRSTATGAKPLTAAQKANIMNQATAAVDKQINEAPALRLSSQQNPGLRQQMITEEYARRLAVAEESPYSAPSSDVAPPTSGGLATQGGRPVPSGGYNDGWGQMTVR